MAEKNSASISSCPNGASVGASSRSNFPCAASLPSSPFPSLCAESVQRGSRGELTEARAEAMRMSASDTITFPASGPAPPSPPDSPLSPFGSIRVIFMPPFLSFWSTPLSGVPLNLTSAVAPLLSSSSSSSSSSCCSSSSSRCSSSSSCSSSPGGSGSGLSSLLLVSHSNSGGIACSSTIGSSAITSATASAKMSVSCGAIGSSGGVGMPGESLPNGHSAFPLDTTAAGVGVLGLVSSTADAAGLVISPEGLAFFALVVLAASPVVEPPASDPHTLSSSLPSFSPYVNATAIFSFFNSSARALSVVGSSPLVPVPVSALAIFLSSDLSCASTRDFQPEVRKGREAAGHNTAKQSKPTSQRQTTDAERGWRRNGDVRKRPGTMPTLSTSALADTLSTTG
mmetsp:Transcript_13719/g.27075  ORF Transcript_13719/g.27075 Transcript_13719/m.27075 type:complete len:398 (+) Transcript_13719:634-1827(+)